MEEISEICIIIICDNIYILVGTKGNYWTNISPHNSRVERSSLETRASGEVRKGGREQKEWKGGRRRVGGAEMGSKGEG